MSAPFAAAYGLASALLPLLNVELYALGLAGTLPLKTAVIALGALAVGQTLGKLVLYEAARAGRPRRHRPSALEPDAAQAQTRSTKQPIGTWAGPSAWWRSASTWLLDALATRRWGGAVVLTSAALGLPPLAVVSAMAGLARTPRVMFASACLLGRGARFATLMLPVLLV